MLKFNIDWFRARLYHNLRSLILTGDKLDSRTLEIELTRALGMEHQGDSNHHADAVGGDVAVSIKTLVLKPHILKHAEKSRDFHTNTEKFIGSNYSRKHDLWTNGIEVVQRRQALDMDDVNASAEEVGRATLAGFKESQDISHARYGTKHTYEVIAVHGYNRTKDEYLTSVYIDEYKPPNADTMDWRRTISGVDGYQLIDGKYTKVMSRTNGNCPRHATCYKEYKNLIKYTNVTHMAVPIPKQHDFDEAAITKEITDYYARKSE